MKRLPWRRKYIRQISFGVIVAAIVGGPAAGVGWLATHWPEHASDQYVVVGAISTVVAVWLALIAAVVALMAYILADESPNLSVLLDGRPLDRGLDLLLADPVDDRYQIASPPYLPFRLVNRSGFSARNPSVRVNFTDAMLSNQLDWKITRRTGDDVSLQWSGGGDVSVHGHWEQNVPSVDLTGTDVWVRQSVTLTVEVVAEGFRLSPQQVPIRTKVLRG